MGDANRRLRARVHARQARVQYERHPGAAGAPLASGYRRREPEKSVLHAIVRDHLESFLVEPLQYDGDGYPDFLEREFRRYLDCGILARGFARLRCPKCHFERLVAFSCKGACARVAPAGAWPTSPQPWSTALRKCMGVFMPSAEQDPDGSLTVSLGAKGVVELELVASGEGLTLSPPQPAASSTRRNWVRGNPGLRKFDRRPTL